MGAGREIEYRLLATAPLAIAVVDAALREAGVPSRAGDPVELRDTYLDDAAGSLARAGLGLRLRRTAAGAWLQAKRTTAVADARWQRDECEVPAAGDGLPPHAAALPAPLRDWIEPWTCDRPLLPVLELRTQRERRWLDGDGGPLGELAIDRVAAAAHGRAAGFTELELEVGDDGDAAAQLVARLAASLPLQPAAADKPGHAARLLGLAAAPPAPAAPPTATGPAVAALAQRWFAAAQAAEAGARDPRDAASRHAARVALRRLRGLLHAAPALWPAATAAWLDTHCAATAQRLGAVRDLDVALELLPKALARLPAPLRPAATAQVPAFAAAQRDAAHANLLAWLRSGPRLAAAARCPDLLAAVPPQGDAAAAPLAASAAAWRRAAVRQLRRRLRDLPADLPTAGLHAVRRAARRLRYLLEEFAAAPAAVARLAKLQDALGRVLDREHTAATCSGWVAAAPADTAPALAASLGALAAVWTAAAQRARRRAAARLRRFDRKKVWRLLAGPDA